MAAIKEQVDLRKASCTMNGISITEYFDKVKYEDTEDFDKQLKLEIVWWGDYEFSYDISKVKRQYAEKNADDIIKDASDKNEGNVPDLYFVDIETSKTEKIAYLYDAKVDEIYKIKLTRISRWKVHSVIELDYQQGNETNVRTEKEGTLITGDSQLVTTGNITYYAPNLNGFVKERTSAVYYKIDALGDIVDSEAPKEKPISEYLQTNSRTIEDNSYAFFDYKEKESKSIWANIKVDNNGVITYWVWIPRYAYKIDGDNIYIKYIDIKNNIAGTNAPIDSDYIVHSAFTENNKKGIWVTKYEVEQVANQEMGDFPYYIPDVSGFDKDKTYIELYKDDGTFEDKPLKDIDNLAEFAEKNRWFDYEKQIWANIKVVNTNDPNDDTDDIETWWVWIPRYAYNISGDTTSIIFLDTKDRPLSGEDLPSNYIVHPAFENGKKGIWASKYEIGQQITSKETTNNVNVPDMSGFDPDKTWLEVYNNDGTFTQTLLKNVSNIEQFANANRWYDYSKQIWANIKVVNDQGTSSTSDDIETWWVWIPRYAYNITGDETRIIFLDSTGKPTDGSTLPSNYVPHPAFEDGKTGIWVSKYEISEQN